MYSGGRVLFTKRFSFGKIRFYIHGIVFLNCMSFSTTTTQLYVFALWYAAVLKLTMNCFSCITTENKARRFYALEIFVITFFCIVSFSLPSLCLQMFLSHSRSRYLYIIISSVFLFCYLGRFFLVYEIQQPFVQHVYG